jgi:DNA polymerase III subunit epsilon
VLDREQRRHGIERSPLAPADFGPVIDPLLIDKHLDRYRKGSRKLVAICEHYGAKLDDAHEAGSDALAAARAAWVLGAKGEIVRRVWDAKTGAEKAALVREWAEVRNDARMLHDAQVRWAYDQAISLQDYFRKQGQTEDAESVRTDWPVVRYEEAA